MTTTFFKQDGDYWDYKLSNYIHDPPDKALKITGHEERSKQLADLMQLPSPDPEMYRTADWIASGMDRTPLPGYDRNPTLSGAVDFQCDPCLTHPIGQERPLRIDLGRSAQRGEAFDELLKLVGDDLHQLTGKLAKDRTGYSAARFHYWHHVLRQRLTEQDVGGLGGLWYLLPADTRIPDHTIWQHGQLVSALTSCFSLSSTRQASLLVFSIGPVQDFIARARKLRDYWTGSLILSWLSFEAMRHVIYTLGSDHILYPSPINQPLVDEFLARELGLTWLRANGKSVSSGVASLPNKFVCLVPTGMEEIIAEEVCASVREAWSDLGAMTRDAVVSKVGKDKYFESQFEQQLKDYWDTRWAACPLVDDSKAKHAKNIIPESVWKGVFNFVAESRNLFRQSQTNVSQGSLYPMSHAVCQTFLSAGKGRRVAVDKAEGGIKCSLHGDFEILRFHWGDNGDRNPSPSNDPFWAKLKSEWEPSTDFKDTERLSALGLVKRIAYRVYKKRDGHPLSICFRGAEGFPSSTEVALANWFSVIEGFVKSHPEWKEDYHWDRGRRILAQLIHDLDSEEGNAKRGKEIEAPSPEEKQAWRKILKDSTESFPLRDTDKYYALVFMDGDGMGRLISGETIASSWEGAIHPDLVSRLRSQDFDANFRKFWGGWLADKRLLSPGVHAAISEALADFSLRVVPEIIRTHRGRLIYSGGDDVCAVLPVSHAVDAARQIAKMYCQGFACFSDSNECLPLETATQAWQPQLGRLARLMGHGANISISAGILICHHKKPLSSAISNAQTLLKKYAKELGGRNAIAIELDKRSGGSRRFLARWHETAPEELASSKLGCLEGRRTLLDSFLAVADCFSDQHGRSISSSLIYRLEDLKPGLEAILGTAPEKLSRFLSKQLTRSGIKGKDTAQELLAKHIAAVITRRSAEGFSVETEGLVVAKFIGESRNRLNMGKGGTQ